MALNSILSASNFTSFFKVLAKRMTPAYAGRPQRQWPWQKWQGMRCASRAEQSRAEQSKSKQSSGSSCERHMNTDNSSASLQNQGCPRNNPATFLPSSPISLSLYLSLPPSVHPTCHGARVPGYQAPLKCLSCAFIGARAVGPHLLTSSSSLGPPTEISN
jgi:hypothetical protein